MQSNLSEVQVEFQKGNYQVALDKLNELLKTNSNPQLYYNKALCLYFLQQYKEASEALAEIKPNPKTKKLFSAIQKERDGGSTEVDGDGLIKSLPFFKSETKFADVIGMVKEKDYLYKNVLIPIKKPEIYKSYGKRIGCGVVLYGSPGSGKTLLARAIAGESGANMMIIHLYDILNMYVGNGEKNIHTIFEQARKNSPCIIFIDEIDSISSKRASDNKGEGSAMNNALSAILQEMDGIEKNPEGIFVLGSTNRAWDMDAAFKRSGRFSQMLYVRPPNSKERVALFQYYLRKMKHGFINYNRLALATMGYSAADIADICNNSANELILIADKTGVQKMIKTQDVINAIVKEKPKPSLDEWYLDTKKELLGTIETKVVDNKVMESWKSGRLEQEEKSLYTEMVKDIMKNTSPPSIRLKRIGRAIALRLSVLG